MKAAGARALSSWGSLDTRGAGGVGQREAPPHPPMEHRARGRETVETFGQGRLERGGRIELLVLGDWERGWGLGDLRGCA